MNPPDDIAQEFDACATRSRDATAQGAQAFARLLQLAEQRNSGQIVRVVQFIAATDNGQAFAFDLFDLRALEVTRRRMTPDAACAPSPVPPAMSSAS